MTALARTFVDDAGATHSSDKAAPTIVAQVGDALSLEHMGLAHAQVIGTSGSNINSDYADGNGGNAAAYGDHNANPHDPTMFPTDPISTIEAAMLAQSADLTPSCSSTCFWCVGTVGEITRELDAHGWPDYILQGAYGGKWPLIAPFDPWLLGNATARGVEVITILDSFNDATETQSIPAGYIEITKRYEELAAFLGGDADLSADKRALCAEVNTFRATAAAAAERGVRALGAYAPWATVTGQDVAGWMSGPIEQVGFMLEELGMQILHVEGSTEGGTDASTLGFSATAFPYPVVFWLYDVRVGLDFTSDAFAAAWPHPAVVAKQYAYWPNGGHIHSYEHGKEILQLVGEALGKANPVNDATPCTEVADIMDVDYRVNGIAAGEYACPQPVEYDWCPAYLSSDSAFLAGPGVLLAALAAVAALF